MQFDPRQTCLLKDLSPKRDTKLGGKKASALKRQPYEGKGNVWLLGSSLVYHNDAFSDYQRVIATISRTSWQAQMVVG